MLKHIQQIESEFIFESFSAADALAIGMYLTNKALNDNLSIIVDIASHSKTYYHFANDGATTNNEAFIRRKRNSVLLFHHSTWWISHKVDHDVSSMHEKYGTNNKKYSILYGGWPIIVKDLGVIGTICVSGLTQEADNELIIEALNHHFKKDVNPNLTHP